MSFLNKVKFVLGLECIAKYGEEFVITKRDFGVRVCLDRNSEFWWMEGNWHRYCTMKTREAAEARQVKLLLPEPPKLRLIA